MSTLWMEIKIRRRMIPTDKEIEKVLKLSKEYSKLNVPAQQRINMFDYIKEHWNDGIRRISNDNG